MAKRLIPQIPEVDPTSVEEMLMHFAAEVEMAFICSGAEPGEYTRMDLIKLAQPFALEAMKSRGAFIK